MSFLFNDSNEIREKVKQIFGNTDNYLIALKYNDTKTGLAKLIASNLFYTLDSNRNFILFFDEKGVHEKEISNSIKGDFLIIPWHEIENLQVIDKKNKGIIEFNHLGKRVGYEIPYTGKLFKGNEINFNNLKSKKWNKIL